MQCKLTTKQTEQPDASNNTTGMIGRPPSKRYHSSPIDGSDRSCAGIVTYMTPRDGMHFRR